jgi:hypothetical protein
MDTLQIVSIVVVVLLGIAWYLSYSAARLDRLHAKVEGSMSALDAQLVRRAEATLELATGGVLDPATSLLLADAATESLERQTHHPVTDDPLDGQNFAGRENIESNLTEVLAATLSPEVVDELRAEPDGLGADALARIQASALRVQLARRFHNEAVGEVVRVREKAVVRIFRLAGYAALPRPVDFDDELPPALAA